MSTPPRFPLLLEPEAFEQHRNAENLLLIDIGRAKSYAAGHIPQAVYLEYTKLLLIRKPIGGLLPDTQQLSQVLSSVGLTPETHVVVYDDEGGAKAGRLIWTLHLLGHDACSVLNGGIHTWANEGHELDRTLVSPSPSNYQATIQWPEGVVDADYVLKNLDNPDVVLVDARAPEEYTGIKLFAERGGHIPGAINMDWIQNLDRMRNLRWKPEQELRAMFEGAEVTPDREVIVYCHTHHRSSHTYVVLKWLGYPNVKGYAGSWSEWGNRMDAPIEK